LAQERALEPGSPAWHIGRWLFLLGLVAAAGWVLLQIVRAKLPARIPADLQYRQELRSGKKLGVAAMELGRRSRAPSGGLERCSSWSIGARASEARSGADAS
jgi:hypothetical protein